MIRHSKKKVEEATPEEKETTQQMKELMKEFLKFRHNFTNSSKSMDELLDYSLKLTSIGLDCPTVFNFRKDLFSKYFETLQEKSKESADAEEKTAAFQAVKVLVENEIKHLTKMAMEDPKSYEIWFQRAWVIKTFSQQESFYTGSYKVTRAMIEMDLSICEKYLKKDERNFHAWNYRLELNKILLDLFPDDQLTIIEKELQFINCKLEENYSNYSAIHFFTKFVKMKSDQIPANLKFFIQKEELFDQINNNLEAICISPNEQALWLFQRWLIENGLNVRFVHAQLNDDHTEVTVMLNRSVPESVVAQILRVTIAGEQQDSSTISVSSTGCLEFQVKLTSGKKFDQALIELINPKIKFQIKIAEGKMSFFEEDPFEITMRHHIKNILDTLPDLKIPSLETKMFKQLNIFFIRRIVLFEKWHADKSSLQSELIALKKEFVAKAEKEYAEKENPDKSRIPFFERIIQKQRECSGEDFEELLTTTRLI
jgi:hypothetical protein